MPNEELKRYVEGKEFVYPFNLSEAGAILVTTYMPRGKSLDDFHELCARIGFGMDRRSGYLFDGRNQPGHEQAWEARLYGPLNAVRAVTAIAGFNPNAGAVEVTWNGHKNDILAVFDLIREGELVPPDRVRK